MEEEFRVRLCAEAEEEQEGRGEDGGGEGAGGDVLTRVLLWTVRSLRPLDDDAH